jgi:hypothetical protein
MFDLDSVGGVELDFAGTEYEGLEVRMRPTSIGGLLDLAGTAEHLEGLKDGQNPAELRKQLGGMLEPLADLLVSWNLTRAATAVPASLDGLLQLPLALLGRIISAYVEAQAQAGPKPPTESESGQMEASIPMASPPS